jgi:hypothetical protein
VKIQPLFFALVDGPRGLKDENRGTPFAFCQFPTWPNNGARTKLRAQVLGPTIVSALLTGGGRHTLPIGSSAMALTDPEGANTICLDGKQML